VRGAVGGRPADPVVDARLHNLVDGLCTAAGVPRPALFVIEDPAPNALAYGLDPKRAALAVTTGLLERLERVELEGVLAREVARIKHHDTRPATVAVPLLSLVGGVASLRTRILTAAQGGGTTLADANGVALTRYPPGLVAALEKLRADGHVVHAGSAATAHLWIEPPSAGSTDHPHPPLEERIAALREL
jgi:heat shock protein HtpX